MGEPEWNWGDSNQQSSGQWSQAPQQPWQQTQQHQPAAAAAAHPGYGNYYAQPQPAAASSPSAGGYGQWNAAPQEPYGGPPPAYANNGYGAGAAPPGTAPGFDTSSFIGAAMQFGAGNTDQVYNTATQLGGQFAEKQKEKLSEYISAFNLKYYFAVDNQYVAKKIALLLFPFAPAQWQPNAAQFHGKPLPAKEDVNAPDLYIPLMAFITYIIISGFVFGVQQRFSPEQLGLQMTNALFYVFLENGLVFITKYVLNISHSLNVWHTLALSGYKFVLIVCCLLSYLVGGHTVYYVAYSYAVIAITVFLGRSLRNFVLEMSGNAYAGDGRKRKIYLLLSVVVTQALIMYLLTHSVTSFLSDNYDFAKMAMNKMGMNAKQVPLTADGEVDYEALLKMP